jgi:hypothetical protein
LLPERATHQNHPVYKILYRGTKEVVEVVKVVEIHYHPDKKEQHRNQPSGKSHVCCDKNYYTGQHSKSGHSAPLAK